MLYIALIESKILIDLVNMPVTAAVTLGNRSMDVVPGSIREHLGKESVFLPESIGIRKTVIPAEHNERLHGFKTRKLIGAVIEAVRLPRISEDLNFNRRQRPHKLSSQVGIHTGLQI